MTPITEAHASVALRKVNSPATQTIEQNADLLALFVTILNASLSALEGQPLLGLTLGTADKFSAIGDFMGKSANNREVRAAAVSTQLLIQTLGLLKLATNLSTGRVVVTVGAMFTKKVALAFGLVEDSKQAKLIAAGADIVSSILTVGVGAVELSNPVGWVLLVGAVAQFGVSAYNGYAAVQEK
jgi:hypothetical protein